MCCLEDHIDKVTTSNKRCSSCVDVLGHAVLAKQSLGSPAGSGAGSHYQSTAACSRR